MYNWFNQRLLKLWFKLNFLASEPIVALVAVLWICFSFVGNQISGNHYDPHLAYTDFMQNALQLFLLFIACSLAATANSQAQDTHNTAKEALHHAREAHKHAKELVASKRPRSKKDA